MGIWLHERDKESTSWILTLSSSQQTSPIQETLSGCLACICPVQTGRYTERMHTYRRTSGLYVIFNRMDCHSAVTMPMQFCGTCSSLMWLAWVSDSIATLRGNWFYLLLHPPTQQHPCPRLPPPILSPPVHCNPYSFSLKRSSVIPSTLHHQHQHRHSFCPMCRTAELAFASGV